MNTGDSGLAKPWIVDNAEKKQGTAGSLLIHYRATGTRA